MLLVPWLARAPRARLPAPRRGGLRTSPRMVLATAPGALLGVVLGAATGCAEPTRLVDLPARGQVPAPPVLVRPGTIYQGYGHYILYDDSTFTWQLEGVDRSGRYGGSAPAITFRFDGDGSWTAAGTVRGDTLSVAVNAVMRGADFPDGVYVRVPGVP